MRDATVRTLTLLPVLLAFGCSPPSSRIKKNEELFATYPPDVQAAIRSGQIQQGFDQNQVYMALGKPTKKKAQGSSETWVYVKQVRKQVTTKKDVYKYELELREFEDKRARGEYAKEPSLDETTGLTLVLLSVVKFTDGRVTSWEDPPDQFPDEWDQYLDEWPE